MIHFDLPKDKSSILKVIGVGGGGGNAVNHMFSQQIDGVNFMICNTDAQALAFCDIPNKIQLGPHLTQGLGAGANPDIGRQATEESLEEIRRILEVNTKMAFITAGMGGGTGTGGAPIIAKICRDLGILTVGIVTTPFAYEGKKRQLQAEEGIKNLKQYVDTLLVISNDKLRHQFGNLKMREAFEKADNVLATAAKCITDVINSTGQINVDFADVCTVMRNGGVAILGNAEAAGDNRAQRAIEEALNSPLLNDNDIKGAKWILININSAHGEYEFTMDEVEVIQNYLLTQAGDDTDVILGMGYDNTLGDKIGITLIATGFEHKDPFQKPVVKKEEPKKEEKIVMVLGQPDVQKTEEVMPAPAVAVIPPAAIEREMQVMEAEIKPADDYLMPKLVEEFPVMSAPVIDLTDIKDEEPLVVHWELDMNLPFAAEPVQEKTLSNITNQSNGITTVDKSPVTVKTDSIHSASQPIAIGSVTPNIIETDAELILSIKEDSTASSTAPVSAASGGYLARPSNIYAEAKAEANASITSAEEPVLSHKMAASDEEEELLDLQMQLVEKNDIPAADMPLAHQAQSPLSTEVEDSALQNETEEQKRRAAERLHKLRNLSFNINAADPNNEFETVPAYIRRNMELYNTNSNVETFYSSYEVKSDGNNQIQISTINTFLDGKKPD
ncbi:MAG TPA: cell division protein FtsZ [Chitinophagaceae bacterium]|nr:cell division protein FtsZ [Chitinophagaceae bacterium]HMU58039.1 cell division protein FtsZ [Chitinophagaceae bacterium]